MRTYGWTLSSDGLYFLRNERGVISVWRYFLQTGQTQQVEGLDAYSHFEQIAVSPRHEAIALIASANRTPPRIISYMPDGFEVRLQMWSDSPEFKLAVEEGDMPPGAVIHRRATGESVPVEELADAEAISWTGDDGETVHGLYYPPASTRFTAVGAPPLIVRIHGGPTSQTRADYNGTTQFFATRGFAVLEVNYRGSTGYGRVYRDRLHGTWGVVDVDDAASGAHYLVEQGLADRDGLVILGSSAGGYTVLQSLVRKPGFYRAGVSLYGISNLFMLAQDTHKFEERYTDWLVGALPEAADLYRERSPLFHADRIADPLILFQGTDDTVVPRDQSDSLVAVLRRRGVPHEYHVYEGEGHGFRKPDTIAHVYSSILRFLMQHVIYA
jgi:dipeptidyl aminopeptidase/acylaminoacyl peptidase